MRSLGCGRVDPGLRRDGDLSSRRFGEHAATAPRCCFVLLIVHRAARRPRPCRAAGRDAGRPGARSAGPRHRPGIALSRLPQPVDRRFRRRSRARSARAGARAPAGRRQRTRRSSPISARATAISCCCVRRSTIGTVLLWGGPALILLLGAFGVTRFYRARRRCAGPARTRRRSAPRSGVDLQAVLGEETMSIAVAIGLIGLTSLAVGVAAAAAAGAPAQAAVARGV